jgi:hypothetical protein
LRLASVGLIAQGELPATGRAEQAFGLGRRSVDGGLAL